MTATEPIAPGPASPAPAHVLPDPGRLFDLRAARLAELAEGHAAPEWLRLLSRIAAGQARAVREVRPAAPPPQEGAPLAYATLPRDESWRRMLAIVVAAARAPGLPGATEDALRRLAGAGAGELEPLADALLAGAVPPEQLALAPFAGAALQAWFAALASRLDPARLGGAAAPSPAPLRGAMEERGQAACPACGGPPLASRVRAVDRLRFVSCALCATEWNVARVRCVACETSASPEYFHLEPDQGAKAEACPTCRTYVKVFDEEKRPGAEPAADDAATLTLDLLVAEEGFHRAAPNLYLGVAPA